MIVTLALAAALAAAPATRKYTGVVTDSMCATADHSRMKMGPTDRDCAAACVEAHDATYVLYDGKNVYALSDQQMPEKFAGKKVTVIGTVNPRTKTIQVKSITAKRNID